MQTIGMIGELNDLLGDPCGMKNLFRELSVGIAIIVFLVNTIQCFFGYKLTKLWISISGFTLFGLIGIGIGDINGGGDEAIIWGLVLGIVGAFIAFKLYKIGIFILAFFGGTILGTFIFGELGMGFVLGTILGVLSFIMVKPVIILSTAIPAGILAGGSLVEILGSNSNDMKFFLGVVYAISGIAVQWITNKDTSGKILSPNAPQKSEQEDSGAIGESVSEVIKQTSENINNNISKTKDKLKNEKMKAKEEAKGLSIFEILVELKSIFYSHKISKYLMLYCEYILYYLAIQEVIVTEVSIESYAPLSWNISKLSFTLALIIGVLALSKKKYFSIIAYYTIASITYLIKFFEFHNFNIEYFIYVPVIICIYVIVIKLFLKTEEGMNLNKKMKNLFSNTSTEIINKFEKTKIVVRCQKCGELCDENANFCKACGNKITILTSNDCELNEDVEKDEATCCEEVAFDKDIYSNEACGEDQLGKKNY